MAEEKTTQEKTKEQPKRERTDTNEVFIGNKPFMKYVIATMMQIKETNSAIIKARGKFISRGVDVAEVVKKKFKETDKMDLGIEISIGSEAFKGEEGRDINVSTIDIALTPK